LIPGLFGPVNHEILLFSQYRSLESCSCVQPPDSPSHPPPAPPPPISVSSFPGTYKTPPTQLQPPPPPPPNPMAFLPSRGPFPPPFLAQPVFPPPHASYPLVFLLVDFKGPSCVLLARPLDFLLQPGGHSIWCAPCRVSFVLVSVVILYGSFLTQFFLSLPFFCCASFFAKSFHTPLIPVGHSRFPLFFVSYLCSNPIF